MLSSNLKSEKGNLRERLQQDFVGLTIWPPERASLTALVDLGLSNDSIARYFNVSMSDVSRLRLAYGIEVSAAT